MLLLKKWDITNQLFTNTYETTISKTNKQTNRQRQDNTTNRYIYGQGSNNATRLMEEVKVPYPKEVLTPHPSHRRPNIRASKSRRHRSKSNYLTREQRRLIV